MPVTGVIPPLRTTDLAASLAFYTERAELTLEFRYEDFYTGVRAGEQVFHLEQGDTRDPSIEYVEHGGHLHRYLKTPVRRRGRRS